jgi:DNA-directed RNA polymerase subunit RPC12/RpoP
LAKRRRSAALPRASEREVLAKTAPDTHHPGMRKLYQRNKAPGGNASRYGAQPIAYTCKICGKHFEARRDRTHSDCPDCLRNRYMASLRNRVSEQEDSWRAAQMLEQSVADETKMPWEKDPKKLMWRTVKP